MNATSDLIELLRHHYIADAQTADARRGGVFAHEVSINGDWGGKGTRRADALYAGFTSASGRILVGHEVKVSRSDWRAELAKVGKADTWADACHQWWIVAPSTAIVPPEEIPDGWGLMIPPCQARHRRMRILVPARTKAEHDAPWWAVRSFMARVDTLEHAARAAEIRSIVAAEVKERTEYLREQRAPAQQSIEDQRRLQDLEHLERELGFTIASWRSDLDRRRISVEALRRALAIAAGTQEPAQRLEYARHGIDAAQAAIDNLRHSLRPVLEALGAPDDRTTP